MTRFNGVLVCLFLSFGPAGAVGLDSQESDPLGTCFCSWFLLHRRQEGGPPQVPELSVVVVRGPSPIWVHPGPRV